MPWSDDSTKAEEPAVEEAPTEEVSVAPTEEDLPEASDETALEPEEKYEAESEPSIGRQIESIEEPTPLISETQPIVEPEVEKTDRFVCPPSDDKSAKQRRIEGIAALANGQEYKAKQALNLALCSNPNDKIAQNFLEQINSDLYPPEPFFEYTVAEGDTLSKIAERFLDDRFKFYALAKFNGIENPSMVKPGKVIKGPGEKPPEAAAAPEPETIEPEAQEESVKELPAAEEAGAETEMSEISPSEQTTAPGPSVFETDKEHAESEKTIKINKLYDDALQALESGKAGQAHTFLGQILELEPNNAQAREKLNEVQGQLIETYSRDAMFAYRRQELNKAVRLWDQVLELDPANEMAKLRRAEAVDLMDRLQKLGTEGR